MLLPAPPRRSHRHRITVTRMAGEHHMIVLEGTLQEIKQSAEHLGLISEFTPASTPQAEPNGGQREGPTQEMLVRHGQQILETVELA